MGGREEVIPRYVEALLAELRMRDTPGELQTVYFGGGTPSLLPAEAIGRVLRAATDRWGRAPTEVTVEANPSPREAPDWAALRSAGVDRVSLGVQSLRDEELRILARGHTAAEARTAFADARTAGFTNLSIDLIYAIPGQSLAAWRDGLEAGLDLEPDHLSLYALQLVLDPDEWSAPPRRGALRWRERLAPRQDDAVAADQYRLAEELLEGAGYEHYELSSWSRPGFASRHNAAYWDRRPYTGIGAGAHSYDGTLRSWNTRDLDRYLSRVGAGEPPTAGTERLDDEVRSFEAMALGLRRVVGVSRAAFAAEFGEDPVDRYADAVGSSEADGLLEIADDRLRLSPRGRLLANEVLVRLAPSTPASPRVPR